MVMHAYFRMLIIQKIKTVHLICRNMYKMPFTIIIRNYDFVIHKTSIISDFMLCQKVAIKQYNIWFMTKRRSIITVSFHNNLSDEEIYINKDVLLSVPNKYGITKSKVSQ